MGIYLKKIHTYDITYSLKVTLLEEKLSIDGYLFKENIHTTLIIIKKVIWLG